MNENSWVNKMIAAVVAHRFIIVNAAVMALLVILPAILFPFLSGSSYQGINIGNFGDDDVGYHARGRDILEGHGIGNPTLSIGKNDQTPHLAYSEYALLLPLRLLGFADANIVNIYTVYQAIGIFILVLLIYGFALSFSHDRLLSAVVAVFVIGGYNFVLQSPIRVGMFNTDINIYSRAIIPWLSSVVFFMFLWLVVRAAQSRERTHAVWAGIAFGSLFYVYAYAWTFALAFLASLVIVYAIKKDFPSIKTIGVIVATGFLIGAYALASLAAGSQSERGQQFSFFAGTEYGRGLYAISKLSLLAAIMWGISAWRRKHREHTAILLGMVMAGWIALNQQVITGRQVQTIHYFWFFIIPLDIVVLLLCADALTRHKQYATFKKLTLAIILAAIYASTIMRQWTATFATFPFKQNAQRYAPIFQALNHDKTPGTILYSDKYYGQYAAVYTRHDLFWSRHAYEFNTPIQRLKDALFVYAYMDKESRDHFTEYITSGPSRLHEPTENSRNIYDVLSPYLSGAPDARTYWKKIEERNAEMLQKRQAVLDNLEQDYKTITADPANIVALLKRDGVNYILWDKNQNPEWDLSFIKNLTVVTSTNNIYLHSL